MKNLLLAMLIVAFTAGCQPERHRERPSKPRPECTCPEKPVADHYMVNLEFKDHDGKLRSFPHKIEREYGWERIPDTLHMTKGVSADGVTYYYSLETPDRRENGLVEIEQVDGPKKLVDYKDIEITLIPCSPKPLDDQSQSIVDAWTQYQKHKKTECPVHKDGGWEDDEYY